VTPVDSNPLKGKYLMVSMHKVRFEATQRWESFLLKDIDIIHIIENRQF
jgi:hypothetical protein